MNRFAFPMSLAAGALSLTLAIASAQAQSGGSSGGSSGGASGGGATSGGAATRGGGGTGTSTTGRGTTSGTATPNPALNTNPAAPGQTAVPTPNPGDGQSASPGGAVSKGDGNTAQTGGAGTRATNRGSMPDPSPNTQKQSNSPNDKSQTTHDLNPCMATWDKGTHITKVRWREICARTLKDQAAGRR